MPALRNILASLLALAYVSSSFAEEDSHSHSGHSDWMFHWGPKAGMDFLMIDRPFSFFGSDGSEIGIGFGAGLNGRFEWRNKFYIQPGLMLSYDSASASACDDPSIVDSESGSFRIRRASLMLPVHLGFKFYVTTDLYMTLFTGAWASYGFAGTIDYNPGPDGSPDSDNIANLYGPAGAWNNVATGFALGVTFDVGAKLTVNVDGYFGLNQLAKRDIFYSNYMSEALGRISLCYWLGSIKL